MQRNNLHPLQAISGALRMIWRQPLSIGLFLGLSLFMLLAASSSLAASSPLSLFTVSLLLTWFVSVPALHLLAAGCFSLQGGSPPGVGQILKASVKSLPLALIAAFWASLMIALGALALFFGSLFGWALGLWVLCVAVLENRKGRAAADRAWEIAGFSGVSFALAASALGLLMSSYAVLAAQQLIGEAAIVLYPPLAAMISLPLVCAALLERRA